MNKELEENLYKDFPDLFFEKDLPMTETCMCWGIDCRDGWEPILRSACKMLTCRNSQSVRLKPALLNKLWLKFTASVKPLFRWLEKKLKIPPYRITLPEPHLFDRFPGWEVRFTQIKEKFGTLRIHYSVIPKFSEEEVVRFDPASINEANERFWGYVDGVTSFAEYMSSRTCEKDGKPGRLIRSGWWCTLCADCAPEETKKAENDE